MKKLLLLFLSILCLPAFSQPLNLSDWKQPLIEKSVSNEVYTSILNCEKKTPYYVFYNLYPKDLTGSGDRNRSRWATTVPPDIATICGADYAVDKDYKGYIGIYDRGHLAPAGNFKSGQKRTDLTFSFANAAPQDSNLNKGKWSKLEDITERGSAKKYNGVTVITGVIQSKDKYIKNNIGVPDYYYKIILWLDNNGQVNKEVYLARNIKGAIPQQVDIKYLENLSGMDFGL